ncbi:hypothetical protein B296_00025698 [Ensete ventricosum]|uniref:Uncharacterized protein n=1 Tax=Ensete ventricosum TaxID=4639 RepID=A0A426ZTD4_ENSVE|nr:hypothetical protein B296_00025698 [Ensete ventricosum]
MHPLRFLNSGIRAIVFVQKITFKLRVMRLNRVESFYPFLLRFRSEGNKEEGQQGMARLPIRRRLAAAKVPLQRGGRLRPGPLQGAATRKGSSPQGVTTHRGSSRPRGRPVTGCKGRLPEASPAACAGAAATAAQRGAKRGLGHPFEKRMILPL